MDPTTSRRIVEAIHAEPELFGCIIGYRGERSSQVLHPGIIPSINYNRVVVIVEEDSASGGFTAELRLVPSRPAAISQPPSLISNRSRVGSELRGAGLSCGLAVLSGVGVLGSAAAEVPTGGATTVLLVMSWTGLLTAGAQCVNGIVRSAEALRAPDANSLQEWDENSIYSTASLVVDAIGIASGIVSLPFGIRNLLAVLSRRGGLVSAQELSRMTRLERQAAIQKAIRDASRTTEGRRALEISLREAGLGSRQVASAFKLGATTLRRANVVARGISLETSRRLNGTVRDIVSGVAGIGVSATPPEWTGSGSGSVNWVIVHVMDRE